jgi:2',3'-cyclic-nucleotide 2'-phosphodiesterase/3'-nucleotidase
MSQIRRYSVFSASVVLVVACLFAVARSADPQRVAITILGTTDLHGNIYPVDYYTDKPENRGLAKIATLVKSLRKDNTNVVLIDSGDTIQGTPLEYFHNRRNNGKSAP